MSKATFIIFGHLLVLGVFGVASLERGPSGRGGLRVTTRGEPNPDIVAFFKLAAAAEHEARQKLQAELTQAAEGIRNRDLLLASGDARNREALATLQQAELEARRLAESRDTLEMQRARLESQLAMQRTNLVALEQRAQTSAARMEAVQKENVDLRSQIRQLEKAFEAAKTNVSRMEQQLAVALSEAKVAADVVAALQEDLRKQVALSSQLQEQVPGSRIPSPTKEKRSTREPAVAPPPEVHLNQGEQLRFEPPKARLLDYSAATPPVSTATPALRNADRVPDLLTVDALVEQVNANRLQIAFQARRTGVFRQTVRKEFGVKPVLVAHAGYIFALFHVADTPLALQPFPPEWEGFTATLGREPTLFSITQIAFLDRDPRIVVVPLGQPQTAQLGAKPFRTTNDPARFEDAVLLGNTRPYHGEVKLQPDPAHPRYVRLPRERLGRVSGKFSPMRGDLLMTRTGEMLGIMVNKEYALLLSDLACTRSLQTSAPVQQSVPLMTEMYQQVSALPQRLQ